MIIASCKEQSKPTQEDKEIKASMSRIDSLKKSIKDNELELKQFEDSMVLATNKQFEN